MYRLFFNILCITPDRLLSMLSLFNTSAVAPTGGGSGSGGTGGTGAGSGGDGTGGSAPQSGAPGGSPPSGGVGAGTGQPQLPSGGSSAIDWNTAPQHFRTAHEQLRGQYDPWRQLAEKYGVDHQVAESYIGNVRGMIGESYTIGRQLGYSDGDIQESLSQDLIKTISFLRSAAAQKGIAPYAQGGRGDGQGDGRGQPGDITQQIKRLLGEHLRPIQEHQAAAVAEASNSAFRTEIGRQMQTRYGADLAQMPKEVQELAFDVVSEVFKYNKDGMAALTSPAHDTRHIAQVFQQCMDRFDKVLNAYYNWQLTKARGTGAGAGAGAGGGRPGAAPPNGGAPQDKWSDMTLDEIAEGSERSMRMIPSMRVTST